MSAEVAPRPTMTPEELEAFLENLPRPLRDLDLLRDIHLMDVAHKRERKTGSLTLIIHWDAEGDPVRVTGQPSPVAYSLTPRPKKA